jgi:hypothetical protein
MFERTEAHLDLTIGDLHTRFPFGLQEKVGS